MKRNSDELLTFILDSIAMIASLHDQKNLFPALSSMCRDIVFAERCSIWIWDTHTNTLWTKIADGVDFIETEVEQGIVGSAIRDNKSLIVNDVQGDKCFNNNIDKKTGYTTKTMIVIPMENKNHEVIGAIQVINKKENELFTETDLRYLTLSTAYATESISTILMMEEINKTQKELIYRMGVIAEERSEETGLHIKRVSEYSYLLAKLYGLPEKECVVLRDVSPMHDIGKIGIPDAILNKPGRLNDTEMKIMKTHVQMGYNILDSSDLPLLQAASIVAHEHHEKYDGSGYPRGTIGEDIHIYGRITALADVFDALGSERVYKKAWDDIRIFKLFEEEKGKHFDPKLIELFMENKEKFFAIRNEFTDV